MNNQITTRKSLEDLAIDKIFEHFYQLGLVIENLHRENEISEVASSALMAKGLELQDEFISYFILSERLKQQILEHVLSTNKIVGRESIKYGMKKQKHDQAMNNVKKKLDNDPKQKDKEFVKDCWKSWQENRNNYASKAAFARDMLDKCKYLSSQKKIEDWCREWEKE